LFKLSYTTSHSLQVLDFSLIVWLDTSEVKDLVGHDRLLQRLVPLERIHLPINHALALAPDIAVWPMCGGLILLSKMSFFKVRSSGVTRVLGVMQT
jgi:hypothetical protein